MTAEQINALKELLSRAQTVFVVLPEKPKPDQAAAALSLYLGLQTIDKSVSILAPKALSGELGYLIGVKEIGTQPGNKNLQVSFPYQEERVDKVSYHIDEENNTFNLVVQPKKGSKALDSKEVSFSYTGADADAIITIGVSNLDSLGSVYLGYEELYENASLISLNTYETTFGTLKVDVSSSASYSEVIAYLLQELGVELSPDMSTNLLAGVEEATDTFRSLSTTADTLEIASKLLRMGGRRMPRASTAKKSENGFAQALTKSQSQDKKSNGQAATTVNKGKADTTLHHRPLDGGGRS